MKFFTASILLALCVVTTSQGFALNKANKSSIYQAVDITKSGRSQFNRIINACAQAMIEYHFHSMERKDDLWKMVLNIPGEVESGMQMFLNCGPILVQQKEPSSIATLKLEQTRNESLLELQAMCSEPMSRYESAIKKLEKNSLWKIVTDIPGRDCNVPQIQSVLNCGPIIFVVSSFPALIS